MFQGGGKRLRLQEAKLNQNVKRYTCKRTIKNEEPTKKR